MNVLIRVNGADVTDSCLLSATRITDDSTRRMTTATITIMGQSLKSTSRYDYAHYDQNVYSLDLRELYLVTILDGRDGVTKLFEGRIFAFTLVQSDAPTFDVYYQCDLSDYAAWLDRSVCWDTSVTLAMPMSDQQIIKTLFSTFCPNVDAQADVAALVPTIQKYDWHTKTCRAVLDDMSALSGGEWHVDFNGVLHYGAASSAPPAPFDLSTSPNMVSSFPVKVTAYKHDFNNPVNRAYVRGSVAEGTGTPIEASYSDPVSIGKYGEYAYAVVDTQIMTAWDASLRAKSLVLKYANPVESGSFSFWGPDGLKRGQQVHIIEDNLGIDGTYIIRQLSMQWLDKERVEYTAQFGASQPDLETVLRLLQARASWVSSMAVAGVTAPAAGSVSDSSIVAGGLSSAVINSVNANTILGQITSGQIGSVNAGAIVGAINSSQIATVNAGSIQGAITAGQIGSVNAGTIQGVIVTSQLANQIIDDLAKYAVKLAPVPMISSVPTGLPNDDFPPNSYFYYIPDGHFYKMNAAGTSWAQDDSVSGTQRFYHIGAISANTIIGLIVAAQIQSITAGQITGSIQANQIAAVNASSISGQIQASQIAAVNASVIQGTVSASQIGSITAAQITGLIQAAQIGSINATTINIGQIQDSQIGSINGTKINVGSVASDKFDGYSINVGGGGGKPGRLNIYNGLGAIIAQCGTLDSGDYGGWFKVLGAGGTGYADAKLKTDTGGNLSITDAALTVNGGGGKVYTSPSTFDPTYSTVAWIAEGGSDKASHISRGLVLYFNNTKVGALVRSPAGGYMDMEFTTGGYVLISGQTGVVRADGGFAVSGSAGASGSFVAGAKTITVTKGIITSIV